MGFQWSFRKFWSLSEIDSQIWSYTEILPLNLRKGVGLTQSKEKFKTNSNSYGPLYVNSNMANKLNHFFIYTN